MCIFFTQHKSTDVSSFERVCNCHADWRNVHQNCWQRTERSREFGSTSNRPHNRRPRFSNASPGPPHPASSSVGSSPGQLMELFAQQKNFCTDYQKPSHRSSSACSLSSPGSWLDCRHHKHLQWVNAQLYQADGMYGVMWASGLLMSTLWTECPMVALGLCYGQA
jgi:hypothetical protein